MFRNHAKDTHRRRAARPLRLEALEARWVPAAAGTLPAAAVVSQSFSDTGAQVAASTVSEAGGYSFAQGLTMSIAPASSSVGGPFSATDALNQFLDELMAGVDAARGHALFGGAYDQVGIGPGGTLLPSAFGEGQSFSLAGDSLAFDETLYSGGEQYQIRYSMRVGGGGGGGGVTAVEAADQFFASIASATGDASFPGLPYTYVNARLGGAPSTSGTTTAGTTSGTTTATTGLTGTTYLGTTGVTTTGAVGTTTSGAVGTTTTGTTGATSTGSSLGTAYGTTANLDNTTGGTSELTIAGKGVGTTGATTGQDLVNPSGADAFGSLFGATGVNTLGQITSGEGGLSLPLGSGGLGINESGAGINTLGQFTNTTGPAANVGGNTLNTTGEANPLGGGATTAGGVTTGAGSETNALNTSTIGLTSTIPTLGSVSGATGPGYGYNGLGYGGLLNGTTAGPSLGGGVVGTTSI